MFGFGHFREMAGVCLMASALAAGAQSLPTAPAPMQAAIATPGPTSAGITLSQAIAAALRNDPAYAAAAAQAGSARADASIARSALLPNAVSTDTYMYTEPSGYRNPDAPIGQTAQPIFIANDSVHEYWAQLLVNQNISVANIATYRKDRALAAQATADLESARRDLVARVVAAYFGVRDADAKASVAQDALQEAEDFLGQTKKLEAGGEVAHADVLKAQLEEEQRQREASDAQLEAEKARLELGILLFPDPRTPYTLADQGQAAGPLPDEDAVAAAAAKNNPDLRSALAALKAAHDDVAAAKAGYLPTLSFNYTWGINAAQFAVNGYRGVHDLGYSASAGINIPLWDWFATNDRVKQSELREQVARATLTTAQRQLIAQLEEYYQEAKVAADQAASLQASVETAKESLRLTRMRYTAGEGIVLEVVDAETSLEQAETALADGILRSQVARANLETLTGVF